MTHSRLRMRRRDLGLTQARLAEAVGVSRQTIIAIEGGDYSPSVHLALRIGSVLESSVEELFSTDADRRPVVDSGGSSSAPDDSTDSAPAPDNPTPAAKDR